MKPTEKGKVSDYSRLLAHTWSNAARKTQAMSPVKTRGMLFFGRTCSSLCFQCAPGLALSSFSTSDGGLGAGIAAGA